VIARDRVIGFGTIIDFKHLIVAVSGVADVTVLLSPSFYLHAKACLIRDIETDRIFGGFQSIQPHQPVNFLRRRHHEFSLE
jgi:hypothetical protein